MLDDAQKTKEANASIMGVAVKEPTFKEGMWYNPDTDKDVAYESLRWSVFKNKEAEEMYRIISRDAFAFIKNLNTGKESAYIRFMANVLVQATDLRDAVKKLDEGMKGSMADYIISSMAETNIMDVYPYTEGPHDKPEFPEA